MTGRPLELCALRVEIRDVPDSRPELVEIHVSDANGVPLTNTTRVAREWLERPGSLLVNLDRIAPWPAR